MIITVLKKVENQTSTGVGNIRPKLFYSIPGHFMKMEIGQTFCDLLAKTVSNLAHF